MSLLTKYRPKTFDEVIGQDAVVRSLRGAIKAGTGKTFLFAGPSGTGKAQPLSSLILTPDGWKPMGEMRVGQPILGADGQTYAVTGVFPQGLRVAYRLEFDDGTSVLCDADHLWKVRGHHFARDGWLIKPTKALVEKCHSIPTMYGPAQFSSKVSLPIPPYLLGALIGDGYLSGAVISISIPATKESIRAKAGRLLPEPYRWAEHPGGSVVSPQWRIVGGCRGNSFAVIVRNLGLGLNSPLRFIPQQYKVAPYRDRLELLRGLMDTDGCCQLYSTSLGQSEKDRCRTSFSSSSEQLAHDVADLVRSLGGVAVIRHHARGNKIEFSVNVRMRVCPFSECSYKAKAWHPVSLNYGKRIRSIMRLSSVQQQCIRTSAPDGLYVTDGYNVTHNTTLARIAAAELGAVESDVQEIDAATFTGVDDMRRVTSTLVYRPIGEGKIKALIIDECQRLSSQAWDSLLKILEEPPAWVYWFFCTTEPGKVKKTIRTRCLSYDLKAVPQREILDLLDWVQEQERSKIPSDVLALCAREAQGSPRQALANMAVCASVKSRAEAVELLQSALEESAAIDLARALFGRPRWIDIQQIIADLGEVNAESVRQVVRAYGTKIALSAKSEQAAGRALEILDAFSEPFNSHDGITPVLMACAKVTILSPA